MPKSTSSTTYIPVKRHVQNLSDTKISTLIKNLIAKHRYDILSSTLASLFFLLYLILTLMKRRQIKEKTMERRLVRRLRRHTQTLQKTAPKKKSTVDSVIRSLEKSLNNVSLTWNEAVFAGGNYLSKTARRRAAVESAQERLQSLKRRRGYSFTQTELPKVMYVNSFKF